MRHSPLAAALIVFAFAASVPVTPLRAGPSTQTPAGPTAEQIAARVQAFYDQTKTFRADFKQEYYIKLHDKRTTSEGQVAFEKPGKMSWRYAQPNGNRVVSDGQVLKVYQQAEQQMFVQPVGKSQQHVAALSFLMGQGQLTSSFDLRLLDPATVKFEGGWVLEGTPKEATPAYQKVLLYVDQATAQVRRVLILDAQGNRNRFDFDNPLVNTPVPPGEFTFSPPAGTQIVKP
jgi:outer membrane lipoprotein carrier protein